MSSLNLLAALVLGLPVLALHMVAVALGRALRTYSRSRLEHACERRDHPERAEIVALHDERAERGLGAIEVLTSLVLAALLGAVAASKASAPAAEVIVGLVLGIGALGHVVAGVLGRVHAEDLLAGAWPAAALLTRLASPLNAVARWAEAWAYRSARRSAPMPPRPASVEVEVLHSDEPGEPTEVALPESTRKMLERVVSFAQMDVAEVMVPRSGFVSLPADIGPRAAAQKFAETGLSRILIHGEGRDDIIGVLYAKDLWARLIADEGPPPADVRPITRPALFVPESKNAAELLEELRTQRIQIAIAVDEYGVVSGLVTLEDLLERVVGAIDDEFDAPTPTDPLLRLDEGTQYELEGTLLLDDLNARLNLRLPCDSAYQTVGGLAFHELGEVPEPGATFRVNGVEFTILEVAEHSIRRLRIDLEPAPETIEKPAQRV